MKLLNGYTFLRITMGIAMMGHGIMKLIGGPSFWQKLGGMPPFVPEIPMLEMVLGLLAMAIELVGGIFVAVGFKVKTAAWAIVLVMASAFAMHTQGINNFESLMRNTWPLEIGLVFVAIALIDGAKGSK